ncbi:hypothetical protein DFH11DRAFT_1542996 [Phellopilus nigrolimitatus]|nr:hypothetical protein DFH11DRAFT_1542996 [Phellopilus nigrolimitatus]
MNALPPQAAQDGSHQSLPAKQEGVRVEPGAAPPRGPQQRGPHEDCGTPMTIGTLEDIMNDDHAIMSMSPRPEFYFAIHELRPRPRVLLFTAPQDASDSQAIVGVLQDDTVPALYEEMGIMQPDGVMLYGVPWRGKTFLVKADVNQTSAAFLRVVGSEPIQGYLGDGPKLVREPFRLAEDHALSNVFIDENDAIDKEPFYTSRMNLSKDVDVEEFVMAKDDLSGADIKVVCTEAGLLALRKWRMRVTKVDFSAVFLADNKPWAYHATNMLLPT